MDEKLRNDVERRGRPRENFRIKASTNCVTVAGIRVPGQILGPPRIEPRKIPVWALESRAEVNLIIRGLEAARDKAFKPRKPKRSLAKLKSALSDILWEAYTTGDPDCILTTREGRDEVIERILALVASQ